MMPASECVCSVHRKDAQAEPSPRSVLKGTISLSPSSLNCAVFQAVLKRKGCRFPQRQWVPVDRTSADSHFICNTDRFFCLNIKLSKTTFWVTLRPEVHAMCHVIGVAGTALCGSVTIPASPTRPSHIFAPKSQCDYPNPKHAHFDLPPVCQNGTQSSVGESLHVISDCTLCNYLHVSPLYPLYFITPFHLKCHSVMVRQLAAPYLHCNAYFFLQWGFIRGCFFSLNWSINQAVFEGYWLAKSNCPTVSLTGWIDVSALDKCDKHSEIFLWIWNTAPAA